MINHKEAAGSLKNCISTNYLKDDYIRNKSALLAFSSVLSSTGMKIKYVNRFSHEFYGFVVKKKDP